MLCSATWGGRIQGNEASSIEDRRNQEHRLKREGRKKTRFHYGKIDKISENKRNIPKTSPKIGVARNFKRDREKLIAKK